MKILLLALLLSPIVVLSQDKNPYPFYNDVQRMCKQVNGHIIREPNQTIIQYIDSLGKHKTICFDDKIIYVSNKIKTVNVSGKTTK